MKDLYYSFINFIQEMPALWYITIWFVCFAVIAVSIIKFYKVYNGTQNRFEKLGTLFLAIILFIVLIFLTYIRK